MGELLVVKYGYADDAEGADERGFEFLNTGGTDFYKGMKVDTSLAMIFPS